jgi:zinc protease
VTRSTGQSYDRFPRWTLGALALLSIAMSVESYRLDNGLRVVLAPRPGAPVAAVQAWVESGSADDPANLPGLAHSLEHMLFKGTASRGVGAIAAEIEGAGGEINAFTSLDHIVLHMVVPPGDLGLAVDVARDVMAEPAFDKTELELEREVICDELRLASADPGRLLGQALFSAAFRRHPYRRPVLGNERSVRRIRRADLVDRADRWLRAENLTVVIAGGFDPGCARAMIDAELGRIAPGARSGERTPEPEPASLRYRVIERDTAEVHLALGFPAPPMASADLGGLDLLAIALGQGESSRLAASARERDAAQIAGAQVYNLRDPGLFAVSAIAPAQDAGEALFELARESLALAAAPISAIELDKAVHAVEADAVYAGETTDGLARSLGLAATAAGDPGFDEVIRGRARRATPEGLRQIAGRWLRPERAVIAALGPPEAVRGLGGRSGLAGLVGRAAELALAAPPPKRAAPRRRPSPPANKPAAATAPQVHTLAAGIKVVIHRDPGVKLVAARAVWRGGLRLETPENAGINTLLAAALTRGCKGRDADAISNELDRMAAAMSGFSGRNSFGVRAEWLAADWEAGLDLMLDCLTEPTLASEDIARERRVLIDETGARAESPSHLAFRLFVESLYHKHPYRLDPLGNRASLRRLAPEAVRGFFRRHYPTSETTLAIVGDVDTTAVLAHLRRRLAAVEPRRSPEIALPAERFDGRAADRREVYAYLDRAQAHLVVGFPGATLRDPDRGALEVLAAALGGQGGRLFVELRERRGIAYRVGAHSQEGADPGYFAIVLACQPERLEEALEVIRRTIGELRDKPMALRELARARRYLGGVHRASLERRSALAASLAFYEAHGLGWRAVFDLPERLDKITAADVQRAARRFLDWDLAITATVSPPRATPEVIRRSQTRRRRSRR